MTLYALILFSHIAGTFFLFAGLAQEWLAVSYLRTRDGNQTATWIRLARLAAWSYGPAIGVVLFSGGYLASKIGGDQGWILVSFITLLVIGLIGAIFTTPRIRTIWKAFRENSTALQDRMRDPVLLASVRLRMTLVFGVLLLMASKLNRRLSLLTIACAAAVGMVLALAAWRRAGHAVGITS